MQTYNFNRLVLSNRLDKVHGVQKRSGKLSVDDHHLNINRALVSRSAQYSSSGLK